MPSHSDPNVLLSFILLLIIASATAYYANRKGRNPLLWFIIGVLLGIFAPLVLLFLSSVKTEQNKEGQAIMTEPNQAVSLQNVPPKPIQETVKEINVESQLWYYLDQNHEQMGPVSVIALKELWNRGELELMSYVWADGMDQWQRIDTLPLLKDVLNKR